MHFLVSSTGSRYCRVTDVGCEGIVGGEIFGSNFVLGSEDESGPCCDFGGNHACREVSFSGSQGAVC